MSEEDQDAPRPEEAAQAGQAAADGEPDGGAGEAERIAALEAELAETRDRLLRAVAEMDNLRKRTQREKEDATRFAISRFARDIVTVSDDLARAIEAVPAEARAGGDDIVASLVAGIEMTERQLQQVFERHGVRRFDPAGEKFDPAVHEAMYEIPDPTQPAGTVAQVVEAGYMIADRVLRPARVGVTAGGPTSDVQRQADDPGGAPDAAAPPPADEAAREVSGRAAAGGGRHEAPQHEKIGIKIDRSA